MAGDLGAALADDLTFLVLCWRIVRRDGVALGFTTHDRALVIDGLRHESGPGMAPSAVVASDGLDVDTMEVAGALRADSITAADLAAGRYDDAEVQLFMVDWRDPGVGRQRLVRGTLGTVEAGSGPDAGFAATLRGPTAALEGVRVESYSPECRAELGDGRCRVPLRGRGRRTTVATAAGCRIGLVGIDAATAADYRGGQLRVIEGAQAGIERRVIAVEGDTLCLDEAPGLRVGTAVTIAEGCDKRLSTCAGRFANAANFRGEPHVPGGDLLTRFGGV